jgi:tRNA nucleotidyltransferase/poly(A) polymerase
MTTLSNKILSDPVNRWIFSRAGTEIYLVGGFLRDILLSRTSGDLDYVVRDKPGELGRMLSKKFKGTFINLNKNSTIRVVLKDGKSIDFTSLESSINNDLEKRDFTINAMAWSKDEKLIDPCGGLNDLRNKAIKVVRTANLGADPLRILRAYRHAVQLGFTIHKETRRALSLYADRITEVASERITYELFKILNHKNADIYLKKCFDDNVLDKILLMKKDKLRKNLSLLRRYRLLIKKIRESMESKYESGKFNKFLNKDVSQGLSSAGLIRLSILLIDSTNDIRKARHVRFSTNINKAVRSIHAALRLSGERITENKLYEIFRTAGEYPLQTAYIISTIKTRNYIRIIESAEDYINISKKKLLSGDDIKSLLHVRQGVMIGDIKTDLHKSRFLKKVSTKAEARDWVLSNFK